MEKVILDYIEKEALKLAKRYQEYHNFLHIEYMRNTRRVNNVAPKEVKTPDAWKKDRKFNPFYVLKHKEQIAKSVAKKLQEGSYEPNPPFEKEIPKKDGGVRKITIFQIPDAAVSYRLYKNLLSKNKHRFSALSYAYRNDRNVHYAIQDIALELTASPRVFIAEFDFKDFFGSIEHSFLNEQLDQNGFLISRDEKRVIQSFIKMKEKGIPLGTSISLFLANVVCWRLDRKLEEAGLRFARYADDTIIWSNDYSKICKSFEIINEFSKAAGIKINEKKSEGISLLSKKDIPSEFGKTKEYIEFLGYRVSVESIGIKKSSVDKIKKQISYLLYRNLVYPVKTTPYKSVKIPTLGTPTDDAFDTAMRQIRRYLYGNLTEEKLRKYLNGSYKQLTFKGIMSFYPLINDEEQLKSLDRWLISTILNALRLRAKLLKTPTSDFSNQFPFNMTANNIVDVCRGQDIRGVEVPSFLRIHKAIKLGITNNGIEATMNSKSNRYDYDF